MKRENKLLYVKDQYGKASLDWYKHEQSPIIQYPRGVLETYITFAFIREEFSMAFLTWEETSSPVLKENFFSLQQTLLAILYYISLTSYRNYLQYQCIFIHRKLFLMKSFIKLKERGGKKDISRILFVTNRICIILNAYLNFW